MWRYILFNIIGVGHFGIWCPGNSYIDLRVLFCVLMDGLLVKTYNLDLNIDLQYQGWPFCIRVLLMVPGIFGLTK